MSSYLADQLRDLHAALAAHEISDLMYRQTLDRLRGEFGADQVDMTIALVQSSAVQQNISDHAQVGAVIGGSVHGNVYVTMSAQHQRAFVRYLEKLKNNCNELPLLGLPDSRTGDRTPAIDLTQVYTETAVNSITVREQLITRAARHQFDSDAYWTIHRDSAALPRDIRSELRILQEQQHHYDTLDHQEWVTYLAETDAVRLAYDVASPNRAIAVFYGPQLVTEAIVANPQLVLLGDPGSGKSTTLRHLAVILAESLLAHDNQIAAAQLSRCSSRLTEAFIPVYAPLLPFARRLVAGTAGPRRAHHLWEYLEEQVYKITADPDVWSALKEQLHTGRVLVMLDGLDEVVGPDSRRQVLEAIEDAARRLPNCRMVVTCRIRAYEGRQNTKWRLTGWPIATLSDWNTGQILHFIAAWYHAAAQNLGMNADQRDSRIAQLKSAIKRRNDLADIGKRPLLLTMMALVHLNDGRLPEDRVSLYSRCIDLLLDQWEIVGRSDYEYGRLMDFIEFSSGDAKMLRPLLEDIALHAHKSSQQGSPSRISRPELEEMTKAALSDLHHPNPSEGARRFVEYTDVRAGLLQATTAGDAYSFPHLTFQEYLAGRALVRDVEFVERIMKLRLDAQWRVPIELALGHCVSEGITSTPHQFLLELIELEDRSPEQRQRDFILAAELALDLGWDRLTRGGRAFVRLRQNLAGLLAQLIEGEVLPVDERVHAARLLGIMGDPRPGVCTLSPAMRQVLAGCFVPGSPPITPWPEEWNTQSMRIEAFEIARYPVTNTQYMYFIDEDGYNPQAEWWPAEYNPGWHGLHKPAILTTERLQTAHEQANYPVVGISWFEAQAFCIWLTDRLNDGFSYQLPTEYEWEYVARGFEADRYPWGNTEPTHEHANFDTIFEGVTPVGCFASGETACGALDVAGNVWEWMALNPQESHASMPLFRVSKYERVLRGGSWNSSAATLGSTRRLRLSPYASEANIGFRVIRRPRSIPSSRVR